MRRASASPGRRKPKLTDADGIRDVLRSRRTVQRVFAQRGRRIQRAVRRDAGAAVCPAGGRGHWRDARRIRSAAPPPTPPGSAAAFTALLPDIGADHSGKFPTGQLFGPFLFGGYDINNKLPYTENWSFDIQYQVSNSWLFTAGYVGNHGHHEILPIPFNQPHDRHGAESGERADQSSYGAVSGTTYAPPVSTSEFAGNAPVRVPYIGYDMNSVLYKAEGISNYNALQLQVRKRLSYGLPFTAVLHLVPRARRAERTGPVLHRQQSADSEVQLRIVGFRPDARVPDELQLSIAESDGQQRRSAIWLNGWTIGGQTVAQSGQPYSVYDYSGSVGSLYFGTDDEITNPIVPLLTGRHARSRRSCKEPPA